MLKEVPPNLILDMAGSLNFTIACSLSGNTQLPTIHASFKGCIPLLEVMVKLRPWPSKAFNGNYIICFELPFIDGQEIFLHVCIEYHNLLHLKSSPSRKLKFQIRL